MIIILEGVVSSPWLSVADASTQAAPEQTDCLKHDQFLCLPLHICQPHNFLDVLFDSWDIWKQTDSQDLGTGPAYQNQTHMSDSILNICKLKKILWSKNVGHVKETKHCFICFY